MAAPAPMADTTKRDTTTSTTKTKTRTRTTKP
jgi:hypothetical protein